MTLPPPSDPLEPPRAESGDPGAAPSRPEPGTALPEDGPAIEDPPAAPPPPASGGSSRPYDPEDDLPRMTLAEHLDELRVRLFKSVLAIFGALVVAFIFHKDLMMFVQQPFHEAIAALGLPPDTRPVANSPGEAFFQSLKVCFLTGFMVVSPYVLWQMWGFIAAGLYPHEKKAVRAFFPVSILLFWLGAIAAFVILIPFGLRFLIAWGEQYDIQTMYRIEEYISTCLKMVLGMGLVFQLPIVMLFLQATGMVSRASFKKGWRVAVLCSVIAGMFLTDPSPITQLMMAIPVVGLYFVGIWGGRFVGESKETFRWWKAWPLVIGFALYAAMLIYADELNDFASKLFNAETKPAVEAPAEGGPETPGSGG